MNYLYCIIGGYLLGCINFAYILGRLNGFDIRQTGSGNAGASNVKIALGWKAGIITALFDIFKAFLAVYLAKHFFPDLDSAMFVAGGAAVLGHIFPFFMGFKGGKGYASYIGMLLGINWKLALAMIVYGALVTLISDYIALATISTAFIVLIFYIIQKASPVTIAVLSVLALVILFKHRINIVRILHHEEIGLRDSGKHRVK